MYVGNKWIRVIMKWRQMSVFCSALNKNKLPVFIFEIDWINVLKTEFVSFFLMGCLKEGGKNVVIDMQFQLTIPNQT